MVELLEATRAGNTTETKLIKTIETEKRNTIQEIKIFLLCDNLSSEEF